MPAARKPCPGRAAERGSCLLLSVAAPRQVTELYHYTVRRRGFAAWAAAAMLLEDERESMVERLERRQMHFAIGWWGRHTRHCVRCHATQAQLTSVRQTRGVRRAIPPWRREVNRILAHRRRMVAALAHRETTVQLGGLTRLLASARGRKSRRAAHAKVRAMALRCYAAIHRTPTPRPRRFSGTARDVTLPLDRVVRPLVHARRSAPSGPPVERTRHRRVFQPARRRVLTVVASVGEPRGACEARY